jgi:hypothetical protein
MGATDKPVAAISAVNCSTGGHLLFQAKPE